MDYEGRNIWVMLETYDRTTDELVREMRIDKLVTIDHLIVLVGASSLDDLVLGGWRVEGTAARSLEAALDTAIDDGTFENFVAAVQAQDEDESKSG